jgi:branched-chain amino acid transport system permease protein
MITLGIGELVSAAAWTLPDWFGGEAGVPIDRASGPAWGAWTFGPTREAYALIAIWCVAACLAMWAVSRTPLVRMANAVRDNPVRAAALGCDPRRVRYLMFVLSSFFAGVAGTLGLVNVELVSTESVSMLRSGAVLIATVTGGTTAFFGPVAGAVVLVLLSVPLAGVTRAWPFYLGLFFVVVVAGSPDGLAGFVARARARLSAYGTRTCLHPSLLNLCAASTWTLAVVLVVQWAYAMQSSDGTAGNGVWLGGATPGSPASIAGLLAATGALAGIGWLASHRARRLWTQLARSTPRGAAPDEAGGAR